MRHTLKGEYPSRRVWLDGEELDPAPSQAVMNHSPDGFNWGYGGSGPSQLALAVILRLFGNHRAYHDFKEKVIALLPQGKNFNIEFDVETLANMERRYEVRNLQ